MIEIGTLAELAAKVARLKSRGKTIVLVTGVFDILHSEHQRFLKKAKQAGDILLVGIESDKRVKQLKGPTRPINNLTLRLINLDAIGLADIVFPLPEKFATSSEHRHLITTLKPDILAVSQSTPHQREKQTILEQTHGKLQVVYPHNPAVSTTQLLRAKK